MKSVERTFEKICKASPHKSTLVNFASTITEVQPSKQKVSRYLTKLVDKNDYKGVNRKDLLLWLGGLTKTA